MKVYLLFREENKGDNNWCTAQSFEFLTTKTKRKHEDSELRLSQREVYVLRRGYRKNLLKEIVKVPENTKTILPI